MRVCILPSWYRSNQHPTLGSFFREQAVSLSASGQDVVLIYCHVYPVSKGIEPLRQVNKVDGFTEIVDSVNYRIPKTAWLVQLVHTLKMIRRAHNEQPFDIAHAHSFVGGLVAAVAYLLFTLPYVITEHSTKFSRSELDRKDRMMVCLAYRFANQLIAVSDGLKKDMQRYTTKPIEVIYNMVDNEFFDQPFVHNKSSVFQFFSVAYLTHKKGMDVLLDAMAKVIKQYQNVVLLIGGDGEEKAALQEQVERLRLQSCVEFLGSLSRSEVISSMNSCDAFVLASRHETFGIVYLEAMACGKPIIMTDTDAHLTIVNEQTGLVVSRESVDELALAMIRMIENRDMYQSEIIRKYCFEKFSASVISNKLIEVYRKVLGGLKHA